MPGATMNPRSAGNKDIFSYSFKDSCGHARAEAPSTLLHAAPAHRNGMEHPQRATVWTALDTANTARGGPTVAQTAG